MKKNGTKLEEREGAKWPKPNDEMWAWPGVVEDEDGAVGTNDGPLPQPLRQREKRRVEPSWASSNLDQTSWCCGDDDAGDARNDCSDDP